MSLVWLTHAERFSKQGLLVLQQDDRNAPNWLLHFKRDVHSQTGEDGIIERILESLPSNDNWCVEFGAWDGVFLTNTRHLILSKGFSAVLIEADKDKFRELQRNYAQQGSRVITLNRFVGFCAADSLDRILSDTPIPHDFDLLSIDIDGNDYHVWKRVELYHPKVVVIEFNPTIATEVEFIQEADPSLNQGASLLSLVKLGKEKGYELICVLPFNAFFVRKQYFHLFQLESNEPQVLRTDLSAITHMFLGYDGKLFLRGACKMPWHDMALNESKMQPLPSFFRKYPGNYTRFKKFLFTIFRWFREPSRVGKALRQRLDHLTKRSP